MGMHLIRLITLWAVLFVFWLLLSGHYSPLLISLGAVSCFLVVWLAHRMEVIDGEGHPIHLSVRILPYWAWLCWEIVKANFMVAKIILKPKMSISPVMFKTKATQSTELGRVIYTHSVILTPITLTVDLHHDQVEVHALTVEGAKDVLSGEMDRRVSRLSGYKKKGAG